MNKKNVIQNLIALTAAGMTALFLESVRELHSFRTVRYSFSIPGLEGKRLLFVTDYHEAVKGKLNPSILKAAKRIRPDVILIGGDMVNGRKPHENVRPAMDLINGLARIAPVVHAYGNHECRFRSSRKFEGYDWDGYIAGLDSRVIFVENESTVLRLGDKSVRIYGLNVDKDYYIRNGEMLTKEDIDGYLGERDTSMPTVLLAHDPSWFDAYSDWGAGLTLSGHYHGGVIRLPVIGGVINPKYHLFPKYDYGIYEKNGSPMLVSSGLGQHTIPVRWFNIPELVVVDLI